MSRMGDLFIDVLNAQKLPQVRRAEEIGSPLRPEDIEWLTFLRGSDAERHIAIGARYGRSRHDRYMAAMAFSDCIAHES